MSHLHKVAIALISLIAIVSSAAVLTTPHTQAQDRSQQLQTLFQQLSVRLQDDPGFALSLQLTTPIRAESVLVVGPQPDAPPRTLYEIGSDYVCLRESAGLSEAITCLPYANIASIAWFNAPQ